jgi:uncharacterized membrane protein YbhN (UPF0104 family)
VTEQIRLSSGRRILAAAFVMLGIAVAGYLIYRGLSRYRFAEIVASVHAVPAANLVQAALFAFASYTCLTGFEWLGIRYTGNRLPYKKIALASFVSLSLAHSIGFSGLSSGAIRYRFYTRWGLSGGDVAKLVLFSGATVALGMMTLGGVALLTQPAPVTDLVGVGRLPLQAAGGLLLATVAGYLVLTFTVRRRLAIRRWTLEMPLPWIAAAQILVGTANYLCVAAALHALVASVSDAGYLRVAAAFVSGNLLTMMIHVPGGLGVIEAATLYLVPSRENLIGPLLVFRTVYYVVPLMIGLTTLGVTETIFRRKQRGSSGASAAPSV